VGAYVPPGWPEGVRPPGSSDFEASAIAFPVKFICSAEPAAVQFLDRPLCHSRLGHLLRRSTSNSNPLTAAGGLLAEPKRPVAIAYLLDGSWKLCKVIGWRQNRRGWGPATFSGESPGLALGPP
jgi:hypothetical protein